MIFKFSQYPKAATRRRFDPENGIKKIPGETNIAKAHLDHVNEKLQNKVQALKALQVRIIMINQDFHTYIFLSI